MQKFSFYTLVLATFFSFSACNTSYQASSVQYLDYRISNKLEEQAAIDSLLKPYSDSVNKTMNDVVAVAGMDLEKKQPEGTLNNVLADAMLYTAREKYKTNVDAAFVNYGGVRLSVLPGGSITRGKIFEVAPFDNIIIILKLKGDILQQFLDHMAARGGWPSAGISYQIKNLKAINAFIDARPLNINNEYIIAMPDYVANGGDDCEMLKPIPQENNGYLFRDAVISYFSKFEKEGKKITAQIENRIINAE